MQRTPPPTCDSPAAIFQTPLALGHAISEPNIAQSPAVEQEYGLNIATSMLNAPSRIIKRKKFDLNRNDILDLFSKLRDDQDQKFSAILSSINEVKVSVDNMSLKHDELLKRISILEEERTGQNSKIQFLENKVEYLERQSRSTSIEIRNIPQAAKESKEELKTILKQTADILNVPLNDLEIKDVYRFGKNNTNKSVIADFTTVFTRDKFLRSFKNFNKAHQEARLSTGSLSATSTNGPNKPIYISENLTQRERKLYFLAREFKKQHNYDFCWTSFGKTFLRESEGSALIRITCESDLENLQRNK